MSSRSNGTQASIFVSLTMRKPSTVPTRETLWRIMGPYSIPPNLVRMVQAMYKGSKCAVIDGGGKTDWFDIKSGFLFLLDEETLGYGGGSLTS